MEIDPSRLHFPSLVGLAGRQWRRAIDMHLQKYALTEATWVPLVHLARATKPLRQRDLARALGLDSSSVVRLLRLLEDAGLVERSEDGADRRAKTLVVTDAGHALVHAVEGVSGRIERDLFADIAPADVAATRRVLETICRVLIAANEGAGDE